MSTQLQIDQMTIAEKLRMMEELWDDLRARAADVPMPQWHKDLLDEREHLIESGEAQFSDWEIAKKANNQANFVKIKILDLTELDLIEGSHFYEAQQGGLGSYFLTNLYARSSPLFFTPGFTKNSTKTTTACLLTVSLSPFITQSKMKLFQSTL